MKISKIISSLFGGVSVELLDVIWALLDTWLVSLRLINSSLCPARKCHLPYSYGWTLRITDQRPKERNATQPKVSGITNNNTTYDSYMADSRVWDWSTFVRQFRIFHFLSHSPLVTIKRRVLNLMKCVYAIRRRNICDYLKKVSSGKSSQHTYSTESREKSSHFPSFFSPRSSLIGINLQ